MLNRILAYGQKIFRLDSELGELNDARRKPEIPAIVFTKALLMLFLCRLPSLHAMEQYGKKGAGRRFLGHYMPCADQLANNSELLDVDGLRALLGRMYKRLVRNKVLAAFHGHRLAVIDGHEINASYSRCCDQCLTRKITVKGKKVTQYYHRAVVFQLVVPTFRFLLDFELLRPHEDEGSAAIRLIERVLKSYPRCFDILLGDGLYPQARIFKLLRRYGKHAIVVLKDQKRDLMVDARALFTKKPCKTFSRNSTKYEVWDIEQLDSWDSYSEKVRIVRSVETKTVRTRIGDVSNERQQVSEWIWVTTLPATEVQCQTIVAFGHERWRIENEGFNELSTLWHADHNFHHHPVSITGLWLILFVAHALFHCFLRNLKPCIRKGVPTIVLAMQMFAVFILNLSSG